MTKVRADVFQILSKNEPLTMRELTQVCSAHMNRASIYRTINLFERLGIVQRLQIGWKYKLELSNDFQAHHHHLTCLNCGSVTALPEDSALEKQLLGLAATHHFRATDHQLEISGYCAQCDSAAQLS